MWAEMKLNHLLKLVSNKETLFGMAWVCVHCQCNAHAQRQGFGEQRPGAYSYLEPMGFDEVFQALDMVIARWFASSVVFEVCLVISLANKSYQRKKILPNSIFCTLIAPSGHNSWQQ